MSGFSPEWLALREPADTRARDPGLLGALAASLAGRDSVEVVDLGCGTGANIRAIAPELGATQTLDARRLRRDVAESGPRGAACVGRRRLRGRPIDRTEQGGPHHHRQLSPSRPDAGSRGRPRWRTGPRHRLGAVRSLLGGFHRPPCAHGRRRGRGVLHGSDLRRRTELEPRASRGRRHGRRVQRAPADRQGLWQRSRSRGARGAGARLQARRLPGRRGAEPVADRRRRAAADRCAGGRFRRRRRRDRPRAARRHCRMARPCAATAASSGTSIRWRYLDSVAAANSNVGACCRPSSRPSPRENGEKGKRARYTLSPDPGHMRAKTPSLMMKRCISAAPMCMSASRPSPIAAQP